MQRTYYIIYSTISGLQIDKITHKSPEERQRWHKVEALEKWKKAHRGYLHLNISSVFTKAELQDEIATQILVNKINKQKGVTK